MPNTSEVKYSHFTVKEASLILGFSTNSVYKFLKVGRLRGSRGSKKQGRFRISRYSIEQFLGAPISDEFIESKIGSPYRSRTPRKATPPLPPQPAPPSPPTPPTTPPVQSPIPLQITRALIILALIAIIADLLFNPDFSILQQFIRLSLLAIIVLITYQYGDAHQPPESSR